MESQPQNPEFRINPENIHACKQCRLIKMQFDLHLVYLNNLRQKMYHTDFRKQKN